MTWIEHWGGPKTMLVIFSSILPPAKFICNDLSKDAYPKIVLMRDRFWSQAFSHLPPKDNIPKISCSEIGALVNKQKWRKKAVNLMNNSTKNKICIFYTESLEKLIQMKYLLPVDFLNLLHKLYIQTFSHVSKGAYPDPETKKMTR